MTHEEAVETLKRAVKYASIITEFVVTTTNPSTALAALAIVAGHVFANVSYEDGATVEQSMVDWLEAVKKQYEHCVTEHVKTK